MRRPLLVLFVFLLLLSYVYTINSSLDNINDKKIIYIEGVVKNKVEKEKYDQYDIDEYLVNDYSKKMNLQIGKVVKISGSIKSLDKMVYKDFNYGRYIRSRGYRGLIIAKSYRIIEENKFYMTLGNLKTYLSDKFKYLYKDKSNFINSVLLGQKEYLTQNEKDMFSRTGTSHIIAISGLHMSILCTMMIIIIRNVNRLYKLLVLSAVMILYNMMVGASPSINRSICFVIIMYLAVFLEEKRDGISSLSFIGIILILNNMFIIYNISFQLSFLATLSIIYFYKIVNEHIKISIISLSLSANILTWPIIYYVFKGLPLLFVMGNMIVVPVIGIIMNLGIVNIILFQITVSGAKILAYMNKSIIIMVYYLLGKLADIKLGYIEIKNPKLFCVIFYYILIVIYMMYRELRIMKEQENELQGYYKEYKG